MNQMSIASIYTNCNTIPEVFFCELVLIDRKLFEKLSEKIEKIESRKSRSTFIINVIIDPFFNYIYFVNYIIIYNIFDD